MTVLMHDAYRLLGRDSASAAERGSLFDILHADDTLLVGDQAAHVEELARAVEHVGAKFGMELHWGKTQALSVATDQRLHSPADHLRDMERARPQSLVAQQWALWTKSRQWALCVVAQLWAQVVVRELLS